MIDLLGKLNPEYQQCDIRRPVSIATPPYLMSLGE